MCGGGPRGLRPGQTPRKLRRMGSPPDEHSAAAELGLPLTFHLRDGRTGVIRAAIEDDAEELCRLLPQIDRETDFVPRLPGEFKKTADDLRARIRESSDPESVFLVVEVEGRLVGSGGAAAQGLRRFRHQREFGFAVLKDYWHEGIGRRLTACLLHWAQQRGLHKLHLQVAYDNERAIALYRSFGFTEEGRLVDHAQRADGSYRDVLLMALFLDESGHAPSHDLA